MPNPGNDRRHPPPDLLRRRRAGGLRLPRPHARPQERQEDGALRRRDPDLPPLLRQPGRRREHDPDGLPVPPGGLDGQARDQPGEVDQRGRARGVDRLLARPPVRPPASRRTRSSASARSGWSSPTRAASRTSWCSRPARTRASPTAAATSPPSTRSAAPGAPRPRSASPSRWTTSCATRSTASGSRSEGAHHQYRITGGNGHGQILELVEEPDLPQGTWRFGEGTIHHHAFDVGSSENQLAVKDYIVGLGYTDVSDVKDRGYFFSVYLRTPGGALFELAYSTEAGFTIDEPEDELGTHMCIPPHWEDRRSEIDQLEPIDTIETVK